MDGIRVLREIHLLGADRKFGEVISQKDVEKIPGPSLRALADMRDIELLGGQSSDDTRLGVLEDKIDRLMARVELLMDAAKIKPKAKAKRKTAKSGGK